MENPIQDTGLVSSGIAHRLERLFYGHHSFNCIPGAVSYQRAAA
jgi:hypothetical protein